MAKKQIVVVMADGSEETGTMVERPTWNPDRGCHVGFAKVGDREIAIKPVRGIGEVYYFQLGAQVAPASRVVGQ